MLTKLNPNSIQVLQQLISAKIFKIMYFICKYLNYYTQEKLFHENKYIELYLFNKQYRLQALLIFFKTLSTNA